VEERRQSPHSRVHLFTALLQIGAVARLVLLLVVMLSTHLASQVTWTATVPVIPASQCSLLCCVHLHVLYPRMRIVTSKAVAMMGDV
jgi:hypothetical protein